MIILISVLRMVMGVLLCQNLAIILYGGAETLLRRMGAGDVDIISHTITGKIAMLPLAPSASDVTGALLTAALFLVLAAGLGALVFQKRDV